MDVNVVPMDAERVLVNQTVLVEGDRITALGPVNKVLVPAGVVQIDGRGKYLIPGLADMHAHYIGDMKSYDENVFRLLDYLANGVTTVRHLDDWIEVEKLIKRVRAEGVLGPRSYMAPVMPGLGHDRRKEPLPRPDSISAQVAAYKAAGYDFILLGRGDVAAVRAAGLFDSLLAAARRAGLPVASHDHYATFEELQMLGAGVSSEHLAAYWDALGYKGRTQVGSMTGMPALAAATRRAGVWITVTLNCLEERPQWSIGHYNKLPDITVSRQITKALQDAGVGLLLGGDAGGYARTGGKVHSDLAALVRAGLTPYQALVTGTRNVAQYFSTLDSSGTVAIGKRADLMLLYGNPLQDIRHTRELAGVMIAGRWLDRGELDQRLLASSKWLSAALGSISPWRTAQQAKGLRVHREKIEALADSLRLAAPSAHEGLRRRIANEFSVMRAILTPEQQKVFDPAIRVWLREQVRKGSRVAVPGVVPVS